MVDVMIAALRKRRARQAAAAAENCAEKAGPCLTAVTTAPGVLQATTGRTDPELVKMAEAFGSGIGASGCLCGAVTGGVMALGLNGQGERGGELVAAFRKEFRTTVAAGCRRITSG